MLQCVIVATRGLEAADDVERLAGEPEPADDASRYDRIAWLLAENRPADALALVREAQRDPDLDPERLAMYEALLEDVLAEAE